MTGTTVLAGLAPFDDDSGTHKGQLHIAGGRSRFCAVLSSRSAALPAAFRCNSDLIALYARLIARGKAHNSALTACARKLSIYAKHRRPARNVMDRKTRHASMVATDW